MKYILVIIVFLSINLCVFAESSTILWEDNFEEYTNNTPLINGTNRWYGSSPNIVAQNLIYYEGTQSAKIPIDCTLSNRFTNSSSPLQVWIEADLKPQLFEGLTNPIINTNCAVTFFINSNGYFVVTDSTNFLTLPSSIITNGQWISVDVHLDYITKKCQIYYNGIRIGNNLAFVNTNLSTFNGFDIYNGGSTSYMDNVSIRYSQKPFVPDGLIDGSIRLINSVSDISIRLINGIFSE